MAHRLSSSRSGRTYWAVAAFLTGFAILLVVLLTCYLEPAMDAAKRATPDEKRSLVAWSWMVLAIVLFVLFAGLVLTFRIGRFFLPGKSSPRVHTRHVDAWTEAGKRMKTPDDEDR